MTIGGEGRGKQGVNCEKGDRAKMEEEEYGHHSNGNNGRGEGKGGHAG